MPSEQWKPEPLSGSYKYKAEGGNIVDLKWSIVAPEKNMHPDQAILFLPGVALEADSSSVVSSAKDFADASETNTYSITTRIDNAEVENSQETQAKAIDQFIRERNLKEVKIVGNSQGANKAVTLAAEMESEGKVEVKGIILTNPAGLYDQDPDSLLYNFAKDAVVETPKTIIKEKSLFSKKGLATVRRAINVGGNIAAGVAKEVFNSKTKFAARAHIEAEEAARLNKNAALVKAPIVVVLGKDDINFKSTELMPETAHNQSLAAQEERRAKMAEIFPNSSGVTVLEASKSSNHGLHYMRSKEVAETSLYMLKKRLG